MPNDRVQLRSCRRHSAATANPCEKAKTSLLEKEFDTGARLIDDPLPDSYPRTLASVQYVVVKAGRTIKLKVAHYPVLRNGSLTLPVIQSE